MKMKLVNNIWEASKPVPEIHLRNHCLCYHSRQYFKCPFNASKLSHLLFKTSLAFCLWLLTVPQKKTSPPTLPGVTGESFPTSTTWCLCSWFMSSFLWAVASDWAFNNQDSFAASCSIVTKWNTGNLRCVWIWDFIYWSVCKYICVPYASLVTSEARRGHQTPYTALVSYHMGTGNRTQIICKSI